MHPPQLPPQPRRPWYTYLNTFQQIFLACLSTLLVFGLVGAVVLVITRGSAPEGKLLTDSEIQELREELPPDFLRQADGGKFDSTRHLVDTLKSLGIECLNPNYFISDTKHQVVKCGTGVSVVTFVVDPRDDGTFLPGVSADPAAQSLTTLILTGRNWALLTACDHNYGNRVRTAIGGNYLREQFYRPTDCP
ncbi:hypothetical protein AB0G06_43610 [Nonomuraea dietziae]|uniref:hypothetical protein n=1 Tax=Nonomuraea dietziae TaxID=65515 RepID=UPI0033D86F3D